MMKFNSLADNQFYSLLFSLIRGGESNALLTVGPDVIVAPRYFPSTCPRFL